MKHYVNIYSSVPLLYSIYVWNNFSSDVPAPLSVAQASRLFPLFVQNEFIQFCAYKLRTRNYSARSALCKLISTNAKVRN